MEDENPPLSLPFPFPPLIPSCPRSLEGSERERGREGGWSARLCGAVEKE